MRDADTGRREQDGNVPDKCGCGMGRKGKRRILRRCRTESRRLAAEEDIRALSGEELDLDGAELGKQSGREELELSAAISA